MRSVEEENSASDNEDTAALLWADTPRAIALTRVAVRAVDRLVERSRSSTVQPQLAMALIASSQSAQRAPVMLVEATHLLADRFSRLPPPDAAIYETTAEQSSQPEGNREYSPREPFE